MPLPVFHIPSLEKFVDEIKESFIGNLLAQ